MRDAAAAVRSAARPLDTYAPWARDVLAAPAARGRRRIPALAPLLVIVPSLVGLAEGLEARARGARYDRRGGRTGRGMGLRAWRPASAPGAARRSPLLAELRLGAEIAREMWEHTDFGMLFDESRMVFSIGFNTAEGRLDDSFYDMLASECRLASYVAIAKGDVPQEHWFRLGRAITQTDGGRGARVLEREHVRVPHAAPRDEDAGRARCSTRRTATS